MAEEVSFVEDSKKKVDVTFRHHLKPDFNQMQRFPFMSLGFVDFN